MTLVNKVLLVTASLALLLVAGVGSWLLLYTCDLPDFGHLSQFAPSAQAVVSDRCLASSSTSIPFELIGEPLKDAIATAEPVQSQPYEIARSLMCNHSGGMGKYHLNSARLSWHIRMHFSEDQILTIYANRAYFGPGITGVERASQEFFHKEPDALSVGEAALLAGLLRAPGFYSPRRYPDRALQRRNEVLEEMVAQRRLSAVEATKLEANPIAIQ